MLTVMYIVLYGMDRMILHDSLVIHIFPSIYIYMRLLYKNLKCSPPELFTPTFSSGASPVIVVCWKLPRCLIVGMSDLVLEAYSKRRDYNCTFGKSML